MKNLLAILVFLAGAVPASAIDFDTCRSSVEGFEQEIINSDEFNTGERNFRCKVKFTKFETQPPGNSCQVKVEYDVTCTNANKSVSGKGNSCCPYKY